MNIQWYPGHMTKAKRQMQEDLKLIDLIIELVDARVPLSSRNPDIDQLGQNKSIRAMVAGIPNVGKSTFINTFAGKACAKTGNKPGVTKGKQWIRLNKNVELLDTPGILWPKFEDQLVGIRLACVGSIKDDILNIEELALWLLEKLKKDYPGFLEKRYGISEEGTPLETLEAIAKARGCLKRGEELDYVKASGLIFDDFRGGKIGRITLEWAEQVKADEKDR